MVALDREVAALERMRADLEKHHSAKFVLIHWDDFVGAFDTSDAAIREGLRRFGHEPFLVRKIREPPTWNSISDGPIFASPRSVRDIKDCDFYHVMEIPGHGTTSGEWDLRDSVDTYLGEFPFSGKRVLEIGPASGFLTFEMERRGAQVVAVEVTDEPGWDFVPYDETILGPVREPRRNGMHRLKNSFWFSHEAYHSHAKLHYGNVYDLPASLGDFDVAVMAAVLLHTHSPLQIVEQCARRARALIITDLYYPDLEGKSICRLHPTVENRDWGTWWHFSTDFFRQFLEVIGFSEFNTSTHMHAYRQGTSVSFFTLVATGR